MIDAATWHKMRGQCLVFAPVLPAVLNHFH